jgi:hypothetical protein
MNDLIGLRYCWGHKPGDGSGKTDCFQLTCEARKRLGLKDYQSQFDWVYQSYTETTFRYRLVIQWLRENGRRIQTPTFGAVMLLPGREGLALATVLDDSILFIAPSQNVVRSPIPEGFGRCFWMEQ